MFSIWKDRIRIEKYVVEEDLSKEEGESLGFEVSKYIYEYYLSYED